MNRRYVWLGVVAVLAGVAVPLGAARLSKQANQSTPGASARLVLVSQTMPSPSQPGQPLHVKLVSGTEAFHDQAGVVLTDDQCAPDGNGVSHCLNKIRLASGQILTVRHPHDMSQVACLAPGEHVAVRMSAEGATHQ